MRDYRDRLIVSRAGGKTPGPSGRGASRVLRGLVLCDLALLLVNRLKKNKTHFLVNVPLKWLPPEAFLAQNALNIVWRPGLRPDPLAELTALARPPSWI